MWQRNKRNNQRDQKEYHSQIQKDRDNQMKINEKPSKIKLTKKDDVASEQNNSEEHRILESTSFRNVDHVISDEELDNSTDFNLMIQNVELNRLYDYKETKEFPFVNDVNQWLSEQILFWNIENQPIKFNLPDSSFGNRVQQAKIIPSQILYNLLQSTDTKTYKSSKTNDEESNLKNKNAQQTNQLTKQKVYDPLNRKQLSEIWNNGIFGVYLGYGEPDQWMVKPWVFYSKSRSYKFLKDAFECAKFQFKQIKRR